MVTSLWIALNALTHFRFHNDSADIVIQNDNNFKD